MSNQLYKWVTGNHQGVQVTACMLTQSPYNGVVVEFGTDTKIYDDGSLEFNWRIIDNPSNIQQLTSQNTRFAKYLERVVFDRLSESKGVVANGQENNNADDSRNN